MGKIQTETFTTLFRTFASYEVRDKKYYLERIIPAIIGFGLASANVIEDTTPFGLAFYTYAFSSKMWIYNFLGVALGSLLTLRSISALKYLFSLILYTAVFAIFKPRRVYPKAIVMSSALFLAGLVQNIAQGFFVYDLVISFCESALCFLGVFVMDKGLPLIKNYKTRRYMSVDEIISITIVMSILVISLSHIPEIGGIKLSHVLSILMVFLINNGGTVGAGAAVGVTVGFINSLGTSNANAIIGTYAFSGLVSGIFSRYGKSGISLSFLLANAVITLLLNGSTEVLISVYEILFAAIVFYIIPDNITNIFSDFMRRASYADAEIESTKEKVADTVCTRLGSLSKSLACLSDAYISDRKNEGYIDKKDIVNLFNLAAKRVCAKCGMRYKCWEKDFAKNYSHMFTMLDIADKSGYITEVDLPKDFKDKCMKPTEFIYSFNSMLDTYNANKMWAEKVMENKLLASEQLTSISGILDTLSADIRFAMDIDLENKIKVELDRKNIKLLSAIAKNTGGKDVVVEIKMLSSKYTDDISFDIVPAISEIVGFGVRLKDRIEENDTITLLYGRAESYMVVCGCAQLTKSGESISGDSHTQLKLKDGRCVLAISDGMGSGEGAANESKMTISLLENFLESGFDTETTIKLINSSLIIKATKEIFSTVDMLSINLINGNAQFIKIGAAGAFIRNRNGVKKIDSTSLPIGILKNVDAEISRFDVSDGDVIVMMSDGVTGSYTGDSRDAWIYEEIIKINTKDPQIIADNFIKKAKLLSGGHIKDDMTVLTAVIKKRV